MFLGTVWPRKFADGYEFANALTAWLRLLRGTVHWAGIERFVREVLAASAEHDLPVDEGELMLLVAGRLEAAGLDQRKLPRSLLPGTALADTRLARGPDPEAPLPDPPPDAADRVERLWATTEAPASWAARCAPTARLPRWQQNMPGPGVAPAWPAAFSRQRAPGQAMPSPTMSCSPPRSR